MACACSPWLATPPAAQHRTWRAQPGLAAAAAPGQPAAAAAAAGQRQRQRQRLRLAPPAAEYTPRLPQNVGQPEVMPSPEFSAEEAVRVQLDALARNDEPYGRHGVRTAYEFAHDVGGLDPSLYFGVPLDLYHEDHFCGKLTNKMAPLVNNRSYAITGTRTVPATDDAPETAVVSVEVVGPHAPDTFAYDFHLRRKRVGPRKGSWTTWMLLPASGA